MLATDSSGRSSTRQRVVTIKLRKAGTRPAGNDGALFIIVVSELISFSGIVGNHCEAGTKNKQ
jgi:hypothetical protein